MSDHAPRQIRVIDHDAAVRTLLRDLLEREGFRDSLHAHADPDRPAINALTPDEIDRRQQVTAGLAVRPEDARSSIAKVSPCQPPAAASHSSPTV